MSTPLKQKNAWYDIWTRAVSTVLATAILGCFGALFSALFSLFTAAGRRYLEAPLLVPHWVALLSAALFFLAIVIAIVIARRLKPRVKIKLIDVNDHRAETDITFRLKVHCEMQNVSNRTIDVQIDDYISKELKVMRKTPGALQLQFEPGGGWSPNPSAKHVAVLSGQTFSTAVS
jgi:hypothetical protein